MFRSAILALLCLTVVPVAAHASSVTVTPPASSPNYWQAFSVTVSGVADQDAKLYVSLARGAGTCPALVSDIYLLGETRAGAVTPVGAGSFSVSSAFAAPKADPYERAGSGPGPQTICVHLMPAGYNQQTQNPAPAALAVGEAHFSLGPNCLGYTATGAPEVTRVAGAFGQFALSGQIAWPVTAMLLNDPARRTTSFAAGPWSLVSTLPAEATARLKKGLQVYEQTEVVSFSQPCKAADGSSAPAPYDVVGDTVEAPLRVGSDGGLLGRHELPSPTFAGAAALGSVVTPAVAFAKPGPGTFAREVRVVPAGAKRAVLVGRHSQETMGLMEVKLTSAGKRVLAALGKKVKKAPLQLETTFTPAGGKTGAVKRSTMKIVRG
ncbi:MAG: hypothetical protein JWM73_2636 [Solirubrobacterales bacterium]|nr:hypothetical protein [Solirubrobacterales bacterium]